jgi:hypothetical protein
MTTTGTDTFTMTRDDLIKAVMRNMQALGGGESPITEDYTNITQAMNIVIKSLAKKGVALWVTQDLAIPMVAAKYSYTIGPSGADVTALRPLKIIEGTFIRDANGYDTPLNPLSRQEYDTLGSKTSAGVPNSYYYDAQMGKGVLYLYSVAVDATRTVHAQVQRQFYDMVASGDNFDFPSEWFQGLKWALTEELMLEYGVPEKQWQYIISKAAQTVEECFAFSQETTSVLFQPDPQMSMGRMR